MIYHHLFIIQMYHSYKKVCELNFKIQNQKVYILFIAKDNMDKKSKTKVEIETEILNQLIKLKEVGDTYSDVIRRLLKKK